MSDAAPARRRALVEAGLALGLLALAAVLERARGGIELRLLALAVLLGAGLARRALVALGLARPVPAPVLALEALALALAFAYPPPLAAHVLAGLAALGLALPSLALPAPGARADVTPGRAATLVALVHAGLALAASALVLRASLALEHSWGALGLLAPLALEAFGPGRERGASAAARRAAGWALAAGATLAATAPAWHAGVDVPEFFLRLGLVALLAALATPALLEVLVRGFGGREPAALVRARRRALLRAGLVAATLGGTWALGEVAFRVVPNPYRDIAGTFDGSTWHVPGQKYVHEGPVFGRGDDDGTRGNTFVWNKEGFHDLDHEARKPAGRARVVVLGDSYVDGYMLPLEDLFFRRLEGELAAVTSGGRSVEVAAYGRGGWGQVQELEALRTHGLALAPDLVVLAFTGANDVRNDQPDLEALEMSLEGSGPQRARAAAIERRLWFTAFLLDRFDRSWKRATGQPTALDLEVYTPGGPRAELWEDAWRRADALVGELDQASRGAGARLVAVYVTSPSEISGQVRGAPAGLTVDLDLPSRRLREICARRGIGCVDLLARFRARGGPELEKLHLKHDGHWSALGHRRAAEEIARFLTVETDTWRETLERSARPR